MTSLTNNSNLLLNIKQQNNIIDVIQEHLTLSRKGSNFVGICPFHDDRHPSLVVNEKKQIFKCFSCDTAGDVIRFVSLFQKIKFWSAVQVLAKRAGIAMGGKNIHEYSPKTQKILDINETMTQYFMNYLFSATPASKEAQAYLKKRNIHHKTMMVFKIGYCPDHETLLKFFETQKYSWVDLEQAGLITMSAKHQPRIALTNRIVFPIINEYHRVIGFSGRSLLDQDIKYLNTPETSLFQKKHVFYNETIFSEPLPFLIIVEGYLDVIALHQAQITNSIALMGTNLSQQHIKKIKEQHLNVVLWLDPDIAGINAMLKSSINLIKNNIKVKIYHNNDHKIDPAGLLQKININSQSLKSFLISPLNFALLVYQQQYQKNPNRDQALNELMENIKPFIRAENNPLQQNNAIEQLAKTIQQPSKLIKEYLQLATTRVTTISQRKNSDIMMKAQQTLIWNVFNNQKNFFYFQKNIKDWLGETALHFQEPYQTIWNKLTRYYQNNESYNSIVDLDATQQEIIFGSNLMGEVKKIFSSQILPYDVDSSRQEIKGCVIKMVKKTIIESEIANLKEAKKKSRSDYTIIKSSNKIFHWKKKIKEQEKDL